MMSAILTEPEIRSALRKIKTGNKTAITLSDAAPRGAGRLLLVVKPERAEWYARQFVDGRKRMAKLGDYPALGLAEARERFRNPKADKPVGGTTVADLFAGYLDSLRADRKPSVKQAQRILDHAAAVIGTSKPARDVKPADVVAVIKPIFARGARVQADKHRMYIGAAFRWGMQATHDYRVEESRDWGITSNPVAAVPRDTEAERAGERWLSWDEYDRLLAWLTNQRNGRTPIDKALLLTMLTGQRITEILKLQPRHWNSAERVLTWEQGETKNGLPHVLPVCDRAAAILDSLTASRGGWFFPNEQDGSRCAPHGTARMRVKRYAAKAGVKTFTTRDLRRTWKTLAGEAGLSKEDRDRLQNHAASDVSAVHYDRHSYLREKRAAVAIWQDWLERKIRTARH
jgi:integrase